MAREPIFSEIDRCNILYQMNAGITKGARTVMNRWESGNPSKERYKSVHGCTRLAILLFHPIATYSPVSGQISTVFC
jgi:hypothetical protein